MALRQLSLVPGYLDPFERELTSVLEVEEVLHTLCMAADINVRAKPAR